ncbi:hypothetical protein [Geodermatophilus sp. SYSU D00710]
MQRLSWRSPVRWWFIAVFALIGLVAALMGVWWTAVAMAFFVVAQLASIVHERRKALRQGSRADP